jgi:hypothetical protein
MVGKNLILIALVLLLIGLAHLAAAQNVAIQLTPQGMPIQIPATGGSFNYIIAATNNGTTPQQATVWCMVTLPNGNPYGPVLGPATITLSPGQTLDRLRTQVVPAGAPTGNYTFNAYIGVYSDSIWDSDSFPFEKLATGGSELWVARYNGPGNGADGADALAVDGAGNIYVTGNIVLGPGSGACATIKYNSSGQQQWISLYNDCSPYALALDGVGNVYVAGMGWVGMFTEYATIKYNASGVQQWVSFYSGPGSGDDHANALAADGAGNVYVTGYSIGSALYPDYATIKYDSSGEQQWVARYNGAEIGANEALALAVDGAGNVYVTGYSYGVAINADYATIKYNSSGELQWVSRYNGQANAGDIAYALVLDGTGNVYVTGGSIESGTSSDYTTIKYNASGEQQWVSFYNGPGNSGDAACALALDEAGNVYVTGSSDGGATGIDYATIKYDSSGEQQWVARYDGPVSGPDIDYATALALNGAGNVCVTGYGSGVGTVTDYATIKYSASGQQLWVSRYNGPGNGYEEAAALAVDGAGDVMVTGVSLGIGTSYDYATIKYSGGNLANWMPVETTVFGQPLPQEFALHQNYPNPFNASTAISYELRAASFVSLKVYDTAGRLVTELVNGWREAGAHEVIFDGSNLASGVYLYRLTAGDFAAVQKLILLK